MRAAKQRLKALEKAVGPNNRPAIDSVVLVGICPITKQPVSDHTIWIKQPDTLQPEGWGLEQNRRTNPCKTDGADIDNVSAIT
jgi:hypothetical protein